MTKPLPIGTFKREKEANMEILIEAIENVDLNAKVRKIFVVDTEFDAYDDPRKSFYNEIYPCIFEPKSKVPIDNRSVYQLLSTTKIGKRGDVLKFKSTEKTHTTLKPEKRFPCTLTTTIFLLREQVGKSQMSTGITHSNKILLKRNIF